ncbi:MAG: hypothetical protein OEW67_14660 [Cyclobacteriaceae bacterium]|nr:hypothetical protein [Cyclobacteriaceae bacterium]
MKRKIVLVLFILTALVSCEKEEYSYSYDMCEQGHFYYGNNEKIYIDSLIQNDYLLIGFENIYSNEQINEFLNNQSDFNNENLSEQYDLKDYNYKLIIREFKTSKSCDEIENIIQKLHHSGIVSFAAYTYVGRFCVGLNCTDLMSYSNQFLVSLNDSTDFNKLNNLVTKTNTWIEKDKESSYVIGVDKNSLGNSMLMANYFHETGLFRYAHPNFIFFDLN